MYVKKINCEVPTFCGILFQNNNKKTPIQILIAQCIKGDSFCFSLLFGFFSIFCSPLVCIFLGFPSNYKWEIEVQTQATGAQSFVVNL